MILFEEINIFCYFHMNLAKFKNFSDNRREEGDSHNYWITFELVQILNCVVFNSLLGWRGVYISVRVFHHQLLPLGFIEQSAHLECNTTRRQRR